MKPEATGSGYLCLFLLASLLVHLGIACAVTGGRDGAGGREQTRPALTVEYLDLSYLKFSAAAERGEVAGDAAADLPPISASSAPVVDAGKPLPEARPLAPSPPTEVPSDQAAPPRGGAEAGKRGASDPAAVSGATGGQSRESKASTLAAGVAARDGREGAATSSGPSSATGSKEGPVAAASRQLRGEGAQGKNGSGASLRGSYQQQLKSLIESHKKYPIAARRSRQEGSCVRRFTLGRDGALKSIESVTSCGHPFLDGAATSAVTSVGMFPPLPDEFGMEESFSVTITFTLAGK